MFSENNLKELIAKAFDLAWEKFQKKNYSHASMILSQSLKIDPENNKLIQLFALTQYALGQYDSAIENFEKAIIENGADVIIVGRGIISSEDPLAVAKKYRKAGWAAYLKRINV